METIIPEIKEAVSQVLPENQLSQFDGLIKRAIDGTHGDPLTFIISSVWIANDEQGEKRAEVAFILKLFVNRLNALAEEARKKIREQERIAFETRIKRVESGELRNILSVDDPNDPAVFPEEYEELERLRRRRRILKLRMRRLD